MQKPQKTVWQKFRELKRKNEFQRTHQRHFFEMRFDLKLKPIKARKKRRKIRK